MGAMSEIRRKSLISLPKIVFILTFLCFNLNKKSVGHKTVFPATYPKPFITWLATKCGQRIIELINFYTSYGRSMDVCFSNFFYVLFFTERHISWYTMQHLKVWNKHIKSSQMCALGVDVPIRPTSKTVADQL